VQRISLGEIPTEKHTNKQSSLGAILVSDTVKALFFDVFGTVVDWRNSVSAEIEALGAARGFEVDGEAFAQAWRARYQPSMAVIRSGERPYTRLDVLHRENLVDVLAEFEIDSLDEAAIDALNLAWHRLNPWPDCPPGLKRLKTKYILATMSNGNVSLMVNLAKSADLPWDAILGSEISRSYKPDPKTYLAGVEILDLAPEQCMMVAAHNYDLLAAQELGLKTAFVARPTEYGPGQIKDLKADFEFDVVTDSMIGLADKLGCK
jgi:2-haloacid dehalogenase